MCFKKLLCYIGIHRPLSGHSRSFVDYVTGRTVYAAKCPCGKSWMVDSRLPMQGFKVKNEMISERHNKN